MEKFGNNSIHSPKDEVDEEYEYYSSMGTPKVKSPSSDQGLAPEKNIKNPIVRTESRNNKAVFHIKEQTDKKIVVILDSSKKHGYDSKEFEFILDPNVKQVQDYKLIDNNNVDTILVNDKNPLPGIKTALKRITGGKDIEIK